MISLNDDCLFYIFKFLTFEEKCLASLVCKRFYNILASYPQVLNQVSSQGLKYKSYGSFLLLQKQKFDIKKILKCGNYNDEDLYKLYEYDRLLPVIYDYNLELFTQYIRDKRLLNLALIKNDKTKIKLCLSLNTDINDELIKYAAKNGRIFFLEELFRRHKLNDFELLYEYWSKPQMRDFLKKSDPNFIENSSIVYHHFNQRLK